MEKSQDNFLKQNMDSSPSAMNVLAGEFSLSKNGRVFNNGEGNFKWVTDTGTEHAFTIPNILKRTVSEKLSTCRVYYFDGRNVGFPEPLTNSIRRFKMNFYLNGVLSGAILTEATYSKSTPNQIDIWNEYINFGGYSNWTTTTVAITPGNSIERHVLNHIVQRFNADLTVGQKQGISLTALKHGTMEGQANLVEELVHSDSRLTDFTWYIQAVCNTPGVNLEIDCVEHGTLNRETINVLGWGSGCENGSSTEFPKCAPFPMPGTNAKNKTYGYEKPKGRAFWLQHGRYYYAKGGKLVTSDTESLTFTHSLSGVNLIRATPTFVNQYGLFTLAAGSTDNKAPYNQNVEILECNPRTYAYCIPVQDYAAAYEEYGMTIECVRFYKYSPTHAIAFCIAGKDERFLIYKIDFTNSAQPNAVKLVDTETPIDYTFDNPISSIDSRNESDDYILIMWCSKQGHLRQINIAEPPEGIDYDFETRVYKPVTFGKNVVSNVFRSGGTLLVGAYQFCHSLSIDGVNWTKCSAHTQPVQIGAADTFIETIDEDTGTSTFARPVPDEYRTYKGYPPGTKTTQSIEVCITNIDKRYKHIRIYSIEAISGSGQYGSAVVNMIHEGEISKEMYYQFKKVYGGVTDVVMGGLNISEITKPFIVPYNIQSFCFAENRLVLGGYEEYFMSVTSAEQANLKSVQKQEVGQYIGSDQSQKEDDAEELNNGHKHWVNQQYYKSLQMEEDYEFSWVFEDEYGNNSEPLPGFTHKITMVSQNNKQMWFDMVSTIKGGHSFQDKSPHTLTQSEAAYAFWVRGLTYKFNTNNPFPTWAKKAKLVRKRKNNLRDNRYWVLVYENGTTRTVLFYPDAYGYNSFRKDSIAIGDKLEYFVQTSFLHNYRIYLPTTKNAGCTNFFTQAASSIDTDYTNHVRFTEEITVVSHKDGSDKDYQIADVITTGGAIYGGIYLAQLIKKDNNIQDAGIVYYEETGLEIDLEYKHENRWQQTFPGECFAANITKTVKHVENADDNSSSFTNMFFRHMPILSRFNFAMANEGWFVTTHQMQPDYNKISLNRDYGLISQWVKHLYISDEVLRERTKFPNILYYTDAREANTKYNPYAQIKANNFVDLLSNNGKITGVAFNRGLLFVFFERGAKVLYPNTKEMLETSAGTKIAVGDGSFLISRDEELSLTMGTYEGCHVTDIGVYFIDPTTRSLCITNGNKEIVDLSLLYSNKLFFNRQMSTTTNRNKYLGYWITSNPITREIYATISTKNEYETEYKIEAINSINRIIFKAQNIPFKEGDVIHINEASSKMCLTIMGKATDSLGNPVYYCSIFDNVWAYRINTAIIGGSGYRSCTVSTAIFDLETIVFDENQKAFETITDQTFMFKETLGEKAFYVNLFNQNEIKIDSDEETTSMVSSVSIAPLRASSPFEAILFGKQGQVVFPTNVPPSPIPTNPTATVTVNGLSSGVAEGTIFAVTDKSFLFLKGYKYVIRHSIAVTGDINGTLKFKPHLNFDSYMSIVEDSAGYYEFEARKTFESPLFLYQAIGQNTVVTQIEFSISEISQALKISPELHVVLNSQKRQLEGNVQNPNTDQLVYDNCIVSGSTTSPNLTARVIGAQQLIEAEVRPELVKERLNEYRFSVPYVQTPIGKERVRGVYVVVKLKFTEYFKKFAIHSVKHIFRKSS